LGEVLRGAGRSQRHLSLSLHRRRRRARHSYVVEAAFCARSDEDMRQRTITGFNFSPALGNPFRSFNYEYGGLETLLSEQRCSGASIIVGLHLTGPGIGFRDRGKTSLVLSETIISSITTAVELVTGPWARERMAEERDSKRARRAREGGGEGG
jgi:hypothetical protein